MSNKLQQVHSVTLELLNAILLSFRKDRVKSYEIYPKLKFGVSVLGLKCNYQLRSFLGVGNLSYDYQNTAHSEPIIQHCFGQVLLLQVEKFLFQRAFYQILSSSQEGLQQCHNSLNFARIPAQRDTYSENSELSHFWCEHYSISYLLAIWEEMAFKLLTLEPAMPGLLHIEQHLHLVGQRYKAGRVFTLRANCLAALKLFGKIVITLRYNSGDIFTNCIAAFPIVAHLSTALQNKSHKSFMSAVVPKSYKQKQGFVLV